VVSAPNASGCRGKANMSSQLEGMRWVFNADEISGALVVTCRYVSRNIPCEFTYVSSPNYKKYIKHVAHKSAM
jgi:hypothetical protein